MTLENPKETMFSSQMMCLDNAAQAKPGVVDGSVKIEFQTYLKYRHLLAKNLENCH
jgi:hypothetical protein